MHGSLVAEQVEAYLPRGQPSRPSRTPTVRPRSQAARVYTVTQQAADATPDVVTGTIYLFDTDAHVWWTQEPPILLFLGSS